MKLLDQAGAIMRQEPLRPLFQVTPYNWRPIVYTSLIMSIKYQEDLQIKNKLIYQALELFDPAQMHYWMHIFSVLIDYNFHITETEYN
jgi:hypothetical protein